MVIGDCLARDAVIRQIVKSLPMAARIIGYKEKAGRYAAYFLAYREFLALAKIRPELAIRWSERYPCLHDKTVVTGFDRHYIYHTAWAARVLAETRPSKHIDVSSSLYFCSIASAFVPIEFYDYRPANLSLSNLSSLPGDLLKLPFPDNSVHSLSSMHVVEHVGLGRYGDPLDPDGDIKAIGELKRVLANGGTLLFVVPVGRPRIMFNAHRIYSYEQILKYFADLQLIEFALIPDNEGDGGVIRNADPCVVRTQSYACGCFWFKK